MNHPASQHGQLHKQQILRIKILPNECIHYITTDNSAVIFSIKKGDITGANNGNDEI